MKRTTSEASDMTELPPPSPEPLEAQKPCVHRYIRILKSENLVTAEAKGEMLVKPSAKCA